MIIEKILSFYILFLLIKNGLFSPCIPAKGKVAIIIGQDYKSIHNYTHFFHRYSRPYGYMTYTSLKGDQGELPALTYPIDYGSGLEWAEGLIYSYPGSAIQLGLYLVNQLDSIISGDYDEIILKLAKYIFDHRNGTNFYLRIGYEFDNSEYHYPSEKYRLAYHHIVHTFRERKVSNVAFVWHSMGESLKGGISGGGGNSVYEKWFPGKEFVDFCGISIFQQPYRCSNPWNCSMEYVEKFSEFCESNDIPIMIGESAPFGGIVSNESDRNRAGYKGNSWNHWFIPVLSYIQKYDVRIWSYINCNWDLFPMWQRNHAPGVFWGDSRIEVSEEIAAHWIKEVLQSPNIISFSEECRYDGTSESQNNETTNNTTTTTILTNFLIICALSIIILYALYWNLTLCFGQFYIGQKRNEINYNEYELIP